MTWRYDPDALLLTDDAARLIGIRPGLVRLWAHRGEITRHPGRDGRPRYRLAEVQDRDLKRRRTTLLDTPLTC